VADFGVAKAQGQLHRPTETGEMKGKLAYMAPEQVTAKEIDHRADIFALGCVLYEITVGRRPFQGEGALSTLYQLLEQNVAPPGEVVAGYPEELASIVLKALTKDPEGRFPTAEDLRIALEGWLASTGSKANEREIAALLRATLGDEIDQKSRNINEAAARLKEGPSERSDGTPSRRSQPAQGITASGHREAATTVDRGVATGGVREKSSSWWLPLGARARTSTSTRTCAARPRVGPGRGRGRADHGPHHPRPRQPAHRRRRAGRGALHAQCRSGCARAHRSSECSQLHQRHSQHRL
jgi:serine/threonine-protein kinase